MVGEWDVIEEVLLIVVKDRWHQVRSTALATINSLVNKKTTKKNIESIISILKKIEREDSYSYVQDEARELIKQFKEIL